MKKALLASFVLLTASAVGQYSTTYKAGLYDLTANVKAGLNVWKNLPGGGSCQPNSGSMSYGGTLYFCVGTDGTGFSYAYNRKTQTWNQQTQLGTGMKALAVKNPRAIYGLFPSPSICASPDMVVEFYDGNSWKYTPTVMCLSQITVGGDGFLAGITNSAQYPRWLWNSPDGGKTWNHWDTNWFHVHMWNSDRGCAVNANGSVYIMSATPNQPPQGLGGNFVGCIYGDRPFVLMAWDANGNVSMQDEKTGAWDAVSGLNANHIAGINKLMVIAIDQNHSPHHWNVMAKYWSGHTTGTWTSGCPSPSSPCHPTTQHQSNLTVQFHSGHGIGSKSNIQKVTWNQPMNNFVWDGSPGCDPTFGRPADPECQVDFVAYETCLQSDQGIGSADPPNPTRSGISHDYQTATSYYGRMGPQLDFTSPTGVQYWFGTQWLNMADGCLPGTFPTCPGPDPVGYDAIGIGSFGASNVEFQLDNEWRLENPFLSEEDWDNSGLGGTVQCLGDQITWGTSGNFDDPNFVPTCD